MVLAGKPRADTCNNHGVVVFSQIIIYIIYKIHTQGLEFGHVLLSLFVRCTYVVQKKEEKKKKKKKEWWTDFLRQWSTPDIGVVSCELFRQRQLHVVRNWRHVPDNCHAQVHDTCLILERKQGLPKTQRS